MKEYKQFSETGHAMINIARRLCKDEDLCKLLKNTSKDPLSAKLDDHAQVFLKNITVIPRVNFDDFKETKIVINVPEVSTSERNDEFAETLFMIDVFSTFDQWIINDDLVRPMKIMDCILNDLNRKRITSLGTLIFRQVRLETVSDEISCHRMVFEVSVNG